MKISYTLVLQSRDGIYENEIQAGQDLADHLSKIHDKFNIKKVRYGDVTMSDHKEVINTGRY